MSLDEEDEFAEFVFAATCVTDSETNISMDHQDDRLHVQ